ncbi:MAG: aspartate aminotransferase family protein [Candidatus Syntrophonatronum acetioxidans]|uniref:Aspartate aminotransferase family protein n=1 Tax=Candidatus Syntrophonatronum acetioxidans TaxID=1795816 RepID=A0A424YI54_9FIRM|nr:MAG: aspartate aminotransferase family protein [Candidatus Syntrophonatronum acetioxidans]
MDSSKLISLEKALSIDQAENINNHKKYANSGLVNYLSLLNFNRRYVRAQGSSLWDEEGNEYLDFLAGYGSLNIGHNHPGIIEALGKVTENPNLVQTSLNPLAGTLAANLAAITPPNLQRSFFCNSGAEAVEAAIKLARTATGRAKILYCDCSFHGKTLGSLSTTGRPKYQEPFAPLLSWCTRIPYGDTDALEKVLKDREYAGFILEPIQGEGGINLPPPGYLKRAEEICKKNGTLLIMDEIQTGLGRTGHLFAFQHEGIIPDILCLAKSLGGGIMPMGAIVARDDSWQKAYGPVDKCLLHTSTFGGNTWACAAALAALEIILEEELEVQAREKGEYFLGKLKEMEKKYTLIKEVRGRGLLIGLELKPVENSFDKFTGGILGNLSSNYTGAMVAGELLNKYRIITAYTLNNPNVIRLEPPLNISYDQINYLLESLEKVLGGNKGFFNLALKSSRSFLKGFSGK